MTPFFTVLYACFIVMILVTAASGIAAFAQQTNVTSMMGLNASNINTAMDNEGRAEDIAILHNVTKPEPHALNPKWFTLDCIYNLFQFSKRVPGTAEALSVCDDIITGNIVNHDFGNNQIMINLAHAYLKARGIQ
jgi:hypothetical protein